MPIKFEISVVQVGRSLKVTIPVEIVKHLSLKKGDTVLMSVDDGCIIIEKKA
jgi:antitoxin component of MazEF toxin-antitoxin module